MKVSRWVTVSVVKWDYVCAYCHAKSATRCEQNNSHCQESNNVSFYLRAWDKCCYCCPDKAVLILSTQQITGTINQETDRDAQYSDNPVRKVRSSVLILNPIWAAIQTYLILTWEKIDSIDDRFQMKKRRATQAEDVFTFSVLAQTGREQQQGKESRSQRTGPSDPGLSRPPR